MAAPILPSKVEAVSALYTAIQGTVVSVSIVLLLTDSVKVWSMSNDYLARDTNPNVAVEWC